LALITKGQGVFLILPSEGSEEPLLKWFSTRSEPVYKLSSDDVLTFHQDSLQRLWIGTTKGLICIKGNSKEKHETVAIPNDLAHARITAVAEDHNFIYFGTDEGKLFQMNKVDGSLAFNDLKAGRINDLKFSHSKTELFCSTSTGRLVTVSAKNLQSISSVRLDDKEIFSIYQDQRGILWIEPQDIGVFMLDPKTEKFKYFRQENFTNRLLAANEYGIYEDRKGIVFVRMKGCGFGYFDTAKQSIGYFYNDPRRRDYRFSNMITAFYYDPDGILWLSSSEGALERITLPQNEFIHEQLVDNTLLKAENEVRGICRDSNGLLWLTSKSGKVYVLKDNKLTEILSFDNPANGIYTIIEDHKKNIWLGTKGDGLLKAEPAGGKKYNITRFMHNEKDAYSISSNLVYSLLEDEHGRIWVGTYGGGINLIDQSGAKPRFYHHGNKFEKYPLAVCDRVRTLASDSNGNIWIGTTEGLLLIDPSKTDFYNSDFTRYVKIPLNNESLGDNDVQYIYRDSDNEMWVLTSTGGLNRAIGKNPIDSLRFLNYSTRNGLPSDNLLGCAEDTRGNLWIATQNGISCFDRIHKLFRNYNISDGVPAGGFSESSCVMAPHGELVLGMYNGYLHFNPLQVVQSKIVRNIVFTNLLVNNEDVVPAAKGQVLQAPLNYTDKIVLRHDQNVVSVDYRMLDYRSQDKVNYMYRLVGFNSTWRNNKNETRASFTNLSPGDYTFEVKSATTDSHSQIPPRTLHIVILPPPWKTAWAYAFYFLLGIITLWLIRKYALAMLRLRQRIIIEQKLSDLKLNFFTNVSHELRTPLTLILNPLEEISRTEKLSNQGNRHLTIVRKNAKRMARFINQLLDLRKAQSGKVSLKVSRVELVSFVRRTLGYFSGLAEQKKLSIAIETEHPELFVWIDAEKIDIVIFNVLANALKFTPEGKSIRVILQKKEEEAIVLKVMDEGKGVSDNQLDEIFGLYFGGQPSEGGNFKGTGIGLALSKELIQQQHGKISASKNMPNGLIITIELKTGKNHFEKDDVTYDDSQSILEHEFVEVDNEDEYEIEFPAGNDQLPQLLLVEDNRDLCSFLRVQLSPIFRVETAANGEEGLQKAMQLLPDVVLSDVMMPEMDGITMLNKLKNNPITSHIPVVLLSAKFSVESQIKGLKYGADHYLAKPFRNDFLVASLHNLIEQRKRFFNIILHNRKTIEVEPTEIVITSGDEVFLKKIINIVEENMREPQFNIDIAADSMNMSRSGLYRKLKSLTGLSPVEFVKEIRLKRSLQYLDAGEQNISTIAFEVGFKSAKYFSTCFRQRFSKTPSDYIRTKLEVKH
jgi:signal transduction histidine kinase/ligand-binding sensor domain-containing protein/DNA-binding response OmpR family regulator